MFYSAGRSGIGATVRTVRLARYLADLPNSDTELLIVTGVVSGDRLFRSPRWQVSVLPEIVRAVNLAAEGAATNRLAVLHPPAERALASLVADFRPDTLITTSHRGVIGELSTVAGSLREHGARVLLVLRDIYYPPEFADDFASMSGDEFDLVLVGGPREIRKWVPTHILTGPLGPKVSFVGYLPPPKTRAFAPTPCADSTDPLIIHCQVGGGRDGAPIGRAVIQAVDSLRQRSLRRIELRISTGPLMLRSDAEALRSMSDDATTVGSWSVNTGVIEYPNSYAADHPPACPQVVISMAGYNSCVEAAWTRVPTILVPRDNTGDLEQPIRADLFSRWFPNITYVRRDPAVIAKAVTSAVFDEPARRQIPRHAPLQHLFADPASVARTILGQDARTEGNADSGHLRCVRS
jgi:predicted glycosyltransferase